MTQRMRLILCSMGSFTLGALVVGIVAYAAFTRSVHDSFTGFYYAEAAQAQLETRQLQSLRSGDVGHVISQLELGLDASTLQLASYEDAVPSSQRENYVYAVLGEVRAYRDQHPSETPLPLQRALLQKALSLKASSNQRLERP
jgi:hypothetical protein